MTFVTKVTTKEVNCNDTYGKCTKEGVGTYGMTSLEVLILPILKGLKRDRGDRSKEYQKYKMKRLEEKNKKLLLKTEEIPTEDQTPEGSHPEEIISVEQNLVKIEI